MMRLLPRRVTAAISALFLGLFVLGVDAAWATHFRSGTVRFEKITTHAVAGEAKFRVTFETGWRWSFPFGGTTANLCSTPAVLAQGFIASSTSVGTGSCSPLGTTIGLGSIIANKAYKLNNATTYSSAGSGIAFNGTITRILPEYDQAFATFTFDITFLTSNSPLTLTFNSSARISTLLEGNADQAYQLVAVLNADPAYGTRSPRSVSLPVIPISTGILNQFQLPNIAYDGFTNKYRFSLLTESALARQIPGSSTASLADDMTISDTGMVSFTPSLSGPYAVQFMVGAYDANGVKRHEIPVDLTLHAYSPVVGGPSAFLTTPLTTVQFQPGVPVTFQLNSGVTPQTSGWQGNILSTPAPAGATFTVTPGNGLTPTTGTFTWTPTIDSPSDAMCFQSIYRRTSDGSVVTSAGQLCVNLLKGATATTLSTPAVTPNPSGIGQLTTVTSALTRTIDGAVQPQRTVVFTVTEPDGSTRVYSGLTNASGVASASILVPDVGSYSVTATFNAIVNELLASTSPAGTFTATPSPGASFPVAPVAVNGPSLHLPSPVRVQMYVQTTAPPFSPAPPGQTVEFVITGPGGTQVVTGVTDNAGYAMADGWVPTVAAAHQVFARFTGSPQVLGTAQSSTVTMTPRQRIQLTATTDNALAALQPTNVSIALTNMPQATPIGGRQVSLSWTPSSGAPLATSVTTGAGGTATVSGLSFSGAGTFTLTATVTPTATELNDLGAAASETATQIIVVSKAATALSDISGAPASMPNGAPLTVSSTLTRTSNPSGALASQPVTFTLTRTTPAPVVALNRVATTNAAGLATATFTSAETQTTGTYVVSASFAGTTVLDAATSAGESVYISNLPEAALALAPISAVVATPSVVNVTLTRVSTGAPIPGGTVTLELPTGTVVGTAVTNSAGIASINLNLPTPGAFTATARFPGIAGTYGPAATSVPATVAKQAASLSAPTFSPAVLAAGQQVQVTSVLTTSSAVGRVVVFTLSSPAGDLQQSAVATTGAGAATAIFTTAARGAYSVRADFAGSATQDAASSPTTTIPVYQPTVLTLSSVSGNTANPATVSATLLTTGGAPIAGQTVTFDFGTSGAAQQTATTNASGVATVSVTFPNAGSFTTSASFLNTAGYFTNATNLLAATTATASASIVSSATFLTGVSLPTTGNVGDSVPASATLTRTGGVPVSGAVVTFTVNGPSGSTSLNATTNSSGAASVSVPLNVKGGHTVSAAFAGSGGLLASSAASAPVTALQRTQLIVPPATGFAGAQTTVSATLLTVPGGTPIAGQIVSFDFNGVVPSTSLTTDSNGVASAVIVVPNAGDYSVNAAFSNSPANFVSSTQTSAITIGGAATSLSALTVPDSVLVGDSLSAVTTLQRTTAPAGAVANAPVTFTLTGPNGVVQTQTVLTDASGFASATLTLTARGAYSVTAQYLGDAGLTPASSNTATTSAYQRTELVVAPATATAGQPVSVSATLTAVPGGAPVNGQLVSFVLANLAPVSATTGPDGVATVSITPQVAGSQTITASFTNAPAFFTNSGGALPPQATTATNTATVNLAATQLSVNVPATMFVDGSLTATAVLTSFSGPVSGQTVSFTFAGDAAPVVITAATDATGVAAATFTPTQRGPHSVSASFAGNQALTSASAGPSAFTAVQRTQLSLAPATGFAGAPTTLTATLRTVPGNLPIAGEAVQFISSAMTGTATTDANGVATVQLYYQVPGAFTIDATFTNAAAHFETSSASNTASITAAATALAPLAVSSNAHVGDTLTVSTVLTRTSPPVGAVGGSPVVFTLTSPNASIQTLTATTAANGDVTATFNALNTRGVYQVTAQYVGSSSLTAAASNTVAVSVYESTQLSIAPATATAGQPVSLSAQLIAVSSGAPLAGQVVAFTAGSAAEVATTNASGFATVSITPALSGPLSVSASFSNAAAFFTNAVGAIPPAATTASTTVTVNRAPTQLTVVAPATGLVDGAIGATATLTSIGSSPVAGQTVMLKFLGDAAPVIVSAVTNALGVASATFTPAARGVHSIEAHYAGDQVYSDAVAAPGGVTVYQRTQLVLAPTSGNAGANLALSATLTAVPSGTPIAGQTIQLATPSTGFSGSAVTDAAGNARVTVTFATAGSVAAEASFSNAAGFFANQTGQLVANTSTATVTVADPTPPVVNYSVSGTLGLAGWYVGDVDLTWTVSDPESAVSTQTGCGPVNVWADGTVTFTCEATSGGGTTTKSVTINLDKTAPVITAPGLQVIEATSPAGASAAYPAATAIDATSGLAQLVCAPAVGAIVALGDTTVTCTAQDAAGNERTSPFTVRVVDTTAPSIGPVSAISINATSPLGAIVTYAPPATSDIVDGASTAICVPASGSQFTLGLTTVTCTATDSRGNTRSSAFDVTVTNNAPTFTAPGNISTPATSAAGATVSFTADGHDVEDGPIAAVCTPASGSTFAIGTTAVSCTVSDVAGATATGSFSVTVTNNAPTLVVPAAPVSQPATAPSGASVSFIVTGDDLEDGMLSPTCVPASGATFALGTTVVNCSVTDVAGATATGAFSVTVTNNAPTFTAPASISKAATSPAGAAVSFTAIGQDLEDGPITAVCSPASGSTFALGTTTVTCTVTDVAGATATGSFAVTVTNNAPVVTVPANITRAATSGAGAAVTFVSTATDFEDGALTPFCAPASGSTFAIGTTPVTCSVTDVAGAGNSKTFSVTVTNAAPTFTAPANITTLATSATNAAVTFTAMGNDLEQGAIPAVCSPASGSLFAIGTTTVYCTVTDFAGLTASASFTVKVNAAETAAFLVRHAPVVNGGTTVQGSIRMMLPENMTFNGGSVTGDLLIPGTPQLTRNGNTTLGGTVDGSGSATPTSHRITMNGNTSLARIVRRTDGFTFQTVAAPASPTGTRSVSLNNANDAIGSWSTLKDLTLNGNIGSVSVPGGTYGSFTANGSNKLVLGVAGSTTPTVYNFQTLVLNGSSSIEVVGPVVVTVKNALSLNGSVGNASNPQWLTLKIASGGLTMNGNIAVRGFVEAPSGNVTVNGNSVLTGRLIADSLTLNGSAKLTLVQ